MKIKLPVGFSSNLQYFKNSYLNLEFLKCFKILSGWCATTESEANSLTAGRSSWTDELMMGDLLLSRTNM